MLSSLFLYFLSPRVPLMLHPRLCMLSSLRDLIRSPLVPFAPSYFLPFVPFLSPRVPLMLHPRLCMISSLRDLTRSPLVPFAPSCFYPFALFLSPGSAYAAPEVMHDSVPSGLNSFASCSFRAFILSPFRAFPLSKASVGG